MRTGSFDLFKRVSRKSTGWKTLTDGGYVLVFLPDHPLSRKSGLVFEHRKIIYDIYGENLPPCEFCGKESRWHSRSTHIDHIDFNRQNNDPSNLRVLCNPCNVGRDRKPPAEWKGTIAVEMNGYIKTPEEWSREEGVEVCGATIRRRLKNGYSPNQAIFGEKKTHNGNVPQRPPAPP